MQAVHSRSLARVCFRNLSRKYLVREIHLAVRAKQTCLSLTTINSNRKPYSVTRNMSSTSPIYTVDYLINKLKTDLQAEHVDIEDLSNCGCGMKFDAVIVSPQFEGKPILQRQRLVNQILSEEMKHIHAFTMRTLTPSQWKDAQN